MAFGITTFDANGSGSKGSFARHRYKTSDSYATILASGYFNDVATVLRDGDLIDVYSTHASDGGLLTLSVQNSSNVITTQIFSGLIILQAEIPAVSTADQVYVVAPIRLMVRKIRSVIHAAIAGPADVVLTGKINGSAITGGTITIARSGSGAGTTDETGTISGANTATAGQNIEVETDGGTSTASVPCWVGIECVPLPPA